MKKLGGKYTKSEILKQLAPNILSRLEKIVLIQLNLMKNHGVTHNHIYDVNYYIEETEKVKKEKIMKKKNISMNQDIKTYKGKIFRFDVESKVLVPAPEIEDTGCYCHYSYELHHFIEKTIRKNNPEKYKRIEEHQKLILLPKNIMVDGALRNMHADASSAMSDERFFERWGIEKSKICYRKGEV